MNSRTELGYTYILVPYNIKKKQRENLFGGRDSIFLQHSATTTTNYKGKQAV